MIFIYILQLENNKFYIGKTKNPKFRFESHFNNNGCHWTQIYKPIKIINIIPNCDSYDEDKYTLKYMEKYGINNVRGGSFCKIKLNSKDIKMIKHMINSSTNKCYKCGKSNHYAKNCPNNKNIIYKKKQDKCFRCHRKGHLEKNCYATTYNNNYLISDSDSEEIYSCEYCEKEFYNEKSCQIHENIYCKNNIIIIYLNQINVINVVEVDIMLKIVLLKNI